MIKVWILIAMLSGDSRTATNGITIVDNIASKSECERISEHVKSLSDSSYIRARCVEVWKVK